MVDALGKVFKQAPQCIFDLHLEEQGPDDIRPQKARRLRKCYAKTVSYLHYHLLEISSLIAKEVNDEELLKQVLQSLLRLATVSGKLKFFIKRLQQKAIKQELA